MFLHVQLSITNFNVTIIIHAFHNTHTAVLFNNTGQQQQQQQTTQPQQSTNIYKRQHNTAFVTIFVDNNFIYKIIHIFTYIHVYSCEYTHIFFTQKEQ